MFYSKEKIEQIKKIKKDIIEIMNKRNSIGKVMNELYSPKIIQEEFYIFLGIVIGIGTISVSIYLFLMFLFGILTIFPTYYAIQKNVDRRVNLPDNSILENFKKNCYLSKDIEDINKKIEEKFNEEEKELLNYLLKNKLLNASDYQIKYSMFFNEIKTLNQKSLYQNKNKLIKAIEEDFKLAEQKTLIKLIKDRIEKETIEEDINELNKIFEEKVEKIDLNKNETIKIKSI